MMIKNQIKIHIVLDVDDIVTRRNILRVKITVLESCEHIAPLQKPDELAEIFRDYL